MVGLNNPRAISTSSLGLNPSNLLDSKLRAAASHGFTGVEIVYHDLEAYSKSQGISIMAAAHRIRQFCAQLGLQILSLCPFENFEGHRSPLQRRLAKATHWIEIARSLHASFLQVPAQFDADATGHQTVVVSELQQLADLASADQPVVSIAYEPMSWSTFYPTWQDVVRLTDLVDRGNFKICLDTFHIATKLWASPYDPSGKYPNADRQLVEDLRAFSEGFPLQKLAYVQLSDAERLDPTFSESHPWFSKGEPAEFTWSKFARPFPLETHYGGYLPVVDILRAWVSDTHFQGWVSMETFDRRMRDENVKADQCAERAERSWRKLSEALREPRSLL